MDYVRLSNIISDFLEELVVFAHDNDMDPDNLIMDATIIMSELVNFCSFSDYIVNTVK